MTFIRASPFLRRGVAPIALALTLSTVSCSSSPSLHAATMEVDGRTVAYAAGGSGHSVVFEAGIGDGYAAWTPVLISMTSNAAVFAYDRAGEGRSTAVPDPRDGTHMVAELQRNLDVAHVPSPYVLVGHSLGGPLMVLYARLHPDDVTGIVIVDGRPATFTDRCFAELGEANAECFPPPDVLASLPPVERLELAGLEDTMHQLVAAPPFHQVPVVILTHSKAANTPAVEALWLKMQHEMATELSATHHVVPNTSHNIQLDAPSSVVDAITEVLAH